MFNLWNNYINWSFSLQRQNQTSFFFRAAWISFPVNLHLTFNRINFDFFVCVIKARQSTVTLLLNLLLNLVKSLNICFRLLACLFLFGHIFLGRYFWLQILKIQALHLCKVINHLLFLLSLVPFSCTLQVRPLIY